METSHLGSPLGYRVVQVGEERVPPRPRPVRPLISKRPVQSSSAEWWVPLVAVGIFTFVVSVIVLLAASSVSVTRRVVAERPVEFFVEPAPRQPVVRTAHIPAALAFGRDNAEEKAEPAQNVEADPAAANLPGRERFGTTIEFVRNPIVAGRLAKAESKLVFHLHVSGNFEDEAFT